jgi:hypothetical protein
MRCVVGASGPRSRTFLRAAPFTSVRFAAVFPVWLAEAFAPEVAAEDDVVRSELVRVADDECADDAVDGLDVECAPSFLVVAVASPTGVVAERHISAVENMQRNKARILHECQKRACRLPSPFIWPVSLRKRSCGWYRMRMAGFAPPVVDSSLARRLSAGLLVRRRDYACQEYREKPVAISFTMPQDFEHGFLSRPENRQGLTIIIHGS